MTDTNRTAFFTGRSYVKTIATLWELGFYAERPFDGDTDELTRAALELANENAWDVTGNRDDLAEAITEHVQGMALSVLVRSDWHEPGAEATYGQFELLLCTGGPAVRITGDLDSYREAYRPHLQYQDWGTPWADHPEASTDALLWFAGKFYYGEV
jgi:hypothetical protein